MAEILENGKVFQNLFGTDLYGMDRNAQRLCTCDFWITSPVMYKIRSYLWFILIFFIFKLLFEELKGGFFFGNLEPKYCKISTFILPWASTLREGVSDRLKLVV